MFLFWAISTVIYLLLCLTAIKEIFFSAGANKIHNATYNKEDNRDGRRRLLLPCRECIRQDVETGLRKTQAFDASSQRHGVLHSGKKKLREE